MARDCLLGATRRLERLRLARAVALGAQRVELSLEGLAPAALGGEGDAEALGLVEDLEGTAGLLPVVCALEEVLVEIDFTNV